MSKKRVRIGMLILLIGMVFFNKGVFTIASRIVKEVRVRVQYALIPLRVKQTVAKNGGWGELEKECQKLLAANAGMDYDQVSTNDAQFAREFPLLVSLRPSKMLLSASYSNFAYVKLSFRHPEVNRHVFPYGIIITQSEEFKDSKRRYLDAVTSQAYSRIASNVYELKSGYIY